MIAHWSDGLAKLAEFGSADGQFIHWSGLVNALLFGVIGIALAILGFKLFDWITPKLDVEKELAEKHNLAVAVVSGAVIIGICLIIALAVHGT